MTHSPARLARSQLNGVRYTLSGLPSIFAGLKAQTPSAPGKALPRIDAWRRRRSDRDQIKDLPLGIGEVVIDSDVFGNDVRRHTMRRRLIGIACHLDAGIANRQELMQGAPWNAPPNEPDPRVHNRHSKACGF